MKHVTLFIALLLITALATSVSFAGKANSGTITLPTVTQSAKSPLTDTDEIRSGQIMKTATMRGISADRKATSKPVVRTEQPTSPSMVDGLLGDYHIPGDFANIASAIAVLNYVGLDGDATFYLDAASYTEYYPAVFGGAYDGAGTYKLTITPSVAAQINFISTVDEGKGFAFVGAKNITIDGGTAGLTVGFGAGVFPTNDAFGATVFITAASDRINVLNTHIKGQFDNAVYADQTEGRPAVFVWTATADGAPSTDITFDGCTVTNATFGFKALHENLDFPVAENLYITNCKIGGAFGEKVGQGALTEGVIGLHYDNNIIDGIEFVPYYWESGPTEWDIVSGFGAYNPANSFLFAFGQPSAGHFFWSEATSTIANNFVDHVNQTYNDPGWAFIIYGFVTRYSWDGTRPLVYNNRITGITTTDANGTMGGIRGEAVNLYHNSVRLLGAMGATQVSYCIRTAGATPQYNNAMSNEMTGTLANIRGMNSGASNVSDGNAVFSNGYAVGGFALPNPYLNTTGKDRKSSFGPVGFDADMHITTGPSSAENIGIARILLQKDIDGEDRDTMGIGKRDAGADDFGDLASPFANDVMPLGLAYPGASTPTGITVYPTVIVKNNTNQAIGSFDVNVKIVGGVVTEFDKSVTVTGLNPMETKSITLTDGWVVSVTGAKTITVTSNLVGDTQTGNDIATAATSVTAPTAITSSTTFTFDASAEGWTPAVDFVRSNTFTKLGGPKSGFSWVTERPDLPSTYTEGQNANAHGYATTYPGANMITSPWYNLTGLTGTDYYISLDHSLWVEAAWDRSWVQYTVDGLNWKWLGILNDPNGINWYNEGVYQNALSDLGDHVDEATLALYGLLPPAGLPITTWTSNGDPATGAPTGPTGWVYNQIKVNAATYPLIMQAAAIKFRMIAFSDAATAMDPGGWAFDNFFIGNSAPPLTPAAIKGDVFTDLNGNGIKDGLDAGQSSVKIYFSYFGVLIDSATTDGTGFYTKAVTLPGTYQVLCSATGYAFSVPFGTATSVVDYNSDGVDRVQNFGLFSYEVQGIKFSDLNDNGVKDPLEPGLVGWTIEAHLNTPAGVLVTSDVTDATGAYSLMLPPATYALVEVAKPTIARQTLPLSGGSYTVIVPNASGIVTGYDFGNYVFGIITAEALIDDNGNGIKDPQDAFGLAAGQATITYYVTKDNVPIDTLDLSNGIKYKTYPILDKGWYGFKRTTGVPTGWIETIHADSISIHVDQSGTVADASFLYFNLVTVSGMKFEDLNGNGVKDAGEPPLAGWTVNVNGTYGGSTVTNVLGQYSYPGLGPGSHTVTEVLQTGWTQTYPAVPYTWVAKSGHSEVNNPTGKDLGNFHNFSISGSFFRDRNNNGVLDAGEEGLSGETITLTPGGSTLTGPNGEFTFANVGPVPAGLVLAATAPLGYAFTLPTSGDYAVVATSGTDVTGKLFGAFKGADATKYRTFTSDQFVGVSQKKPIVYKAGKAILGPPNTSNLIDKMINIKVGGSGALQVGLAGQLNGASKEKAYLYISKYGDAYTTFNGKTGPHTGLNRPFDFDVKSKIMLKKWKSMPSSKKNDALVAELLTLQVNLMASLKGHTDAVGNLGALTYTWPGPWGTNQTIDQIADYADGLMTNWEGVPYYIYDSIYNAVSRINGAFANATMADTTVDGGWTSPKLKWTCYKTAYEIPFLKATVAPAQNRHSLDPNVLPEVFALGQNYPNPFNPTTYITFELPQTSIVTLKIFNILGQEVATVLNRQELTAGQEDVEFDASTLSSGVYLYQIVAEELTDDGGIGQTFTQVKKMVLMK